MKRVYIFALALNVFAYLPVYATIINVPDDYPTIQEGIDASIDGDTVLVQPGTYVENINCNGHKVVLASLLLTTGDTSHVSSTIIDGNSSDRVITLENGEDSTTVICGFTIKNGFALSGSGIYCGDNSSPTIRDNRITENSADANGGGIYCFRSSPIIIRNTIRENSAGGLYGLGGGVYCNESDPPIQDNKITDNYGSGICCEDANPLIRNNLISDNLGNGIICRSGSFAIISGNIISGNTAFGPGSYGGGLCCVTSHPTIDGNTICGNYATEDGGGIFCHHNCSPVIINNLIYENSAGTHGGGLLFSDTSPITTNTILWANSAPNGPEVYSYNSSTEISYCNIQGGWEGEGNIDCAPMFCYPDTGNFYLSEGSCCIGAGEDGQDIGALGAGCEPCAYTPGDCDHSGVPLELADVVTMIGMYRGTAETQYTCDCPPHGYDFAPEADPNGNCVAFELGDVIHMIAAYRGTAEASGCEDCPTRRVG